MANAITQRLLVDGPALTSLIVTGILDTSDLTAYTIVDPSVLDYVDQLTKARASGMGIINFEYSISDGLEVTTYFDCPAPDIISVFTGRGKMSFNKEGYRACQNSNPTGLIKINTFGVVSGGTATFTLKIEMRKRTT